MLLRTAAFAAALALSPALLRAQEPPQFVLGRYTISGCLDGVVGYAPVPGLVTPSRVFGRVACFGGFAELVALQTTPAPGDPTIWPVRLQGEMTATFSPEFTGSLVPVETFNAFFGGTNGNPGYGFFINVGQGVLPIFTVGDPTPRAFRSVASEGYNPDVRVPGEYVPGNPMYFELRYRLPSAPDVFPETPFGRVITLTPVPEPSTYALVALGLAGVGVVVRRRRRA